MWGPFLECLRLKGLTYLAAALGQVKKMLPYTNENGVCVNE